MNSDWSVIWPGDGEDKTIALVKLFAMVTLSLKVTWYALRWLPGRGNAIVPVATSPPSDTRIVQIFLLKRFFPSPSLWQACLLTKESGAGGERGAAEPRWSSSWSTDGARAHKGCSSPSLPSRLRRRSRINQDFHDFGNFKDSHLLTLYTCHNCQVSTKAWCNEKFAKTARPIGGV